MQVWNVGTFFRLKNEEISGKSAMGQEIASFSRFFTYTLYAVSTRKSETKHLIQFIKHHRTTNQEIAFKIIRKIQNEISIDTP